MNQQKPYSNFKATMAIARASFKATIRTPSAVVFSLAFPLIFIAVFANIGGGGVSVDVGVAKTCDTTNLIYTTLKKVSVVNLVTKQSQADMDKNLAKGRIDVILDIRKNSSGAPPYIVNVQNTNVSAEKDNIFHAVLTNVLYALNNAFSKAPPAMAELKETTVSGRAYKYIDFILPGMLGFSLLSTGVFGTAFVFLSLRITLVIKRFFATPVKRYSIVLGEMLARIVFALLGAIFIIAIGRYVFGFTLINGFTTVLSMLLLSFIGLIIFMGFGFVVSGIAKNEGSVPPLANIITMPQFLLSGTFFSTNAFPTWLRPISKILPLTHLNDAMRQVANEGAGFSDISSHLLVLLTWGIVIYAVAIKTFKWE